MLESLVLQEGAGLGDFLEAALFEDGSICITADNPMDGDSLHCFGVSGSVMLTKDQARKLAAWLLEAANA